MSEAMVVHPGLILILAAVVMAVLKGVARNGVILLAPMLAMLALWQIPLGDHGAWSYLQHNLVLLHMDSLSSLFATVFALMAGLGGLYALSQTSRVEVPSAFVYAGAAIGVTLAGDLVTLFVFWEVMALASTLVLWSAGTPRAYRSARRYLSVHLLGGVILFAGITGHVQQTGEVLFGAMQLDSAAHWLILVGFLINAAAVPLSAWLPDAYPEASWSGSVFLSAFTTKTAVFVLLKGFAGTELLVGLGLCMVFYGIFYAILENDIRRLLAYSIVSQVGFMVTAIGIGSELAINGVAAHAFSHIVYKALLLMVAGAVIKSTGRRLFSELGGLARAMPLTAFFGVIGALAIAAFPFTSGFATKSLLTAAAAQAHLQWVWLLLTGASACTFLYAGLKFNWLVFFGDRRQIDVQDVAPSMNVAMWILAALCIGLGVWPEILYGLLPFVLDYQPYTWAHVTEQMQLLSFAAIAFFVTLPVLRKVLGLTLDWDWFYRRGPRLCSVWMRNACAQIVHRLHLLWKLALRLVFDLVMKEQPLEARLGGTWSTRSMATWVLVLLLSYLLLYFF